MTVTLYWNKICPFVQRAWITLIEKKVAFELVYVPLSGGTPAWYAEINPRATVPTLKHDDRIIFESNLIAQYVDDTFDPKQSLFPGSAYDRHRVRFFLEQVGEFVGAAYGFLMDRSGKDEFEANVKNLEKLLAEQSPSGPFFLGDTFSLADVALVPFLDRFRHTLFAFADGYDIFASAPRLKALLDAAFLRPSVFQTSQSAAFYIDAYKGYVTNGPVEPTNRPLKLYTNANCPFCERVKIALALKNIVVDEIEIDLANPPAWYTAEINPRGTVPALALGDGRIVHESNLIVAYFDEEFVSEDRPTLVPADGLARYQQNLFLEAAGGLVGAGYGLLFAKGSDEKRTALQEAARPVEELLSQQSAAGPFFFGAEASLADIALLPHLVRFSAGLPEFGNGYALFTEFPRLGGLVKAAREHAIIGKVLKEPEAYLSVIRERIAKSA
jgi:glutathione S-transferase